MLFLFRYNNPFVIFLLLLLSFALHAVGFFFPNEIKAGISNEMQGFLNQFGINTLFGLIISSILIVIEGLYFQFIIKKHEVLYKLSYLPSAMYIICCSAFSEQLGLIPQHVINFILIIIIDNIFKLYKTERPFETIFNCGFLLGLCTLVSIEVSLLFLLLLFSLNYFRPFNWKENLTLFLSYLLPFYFAGSIFYLTDRFGPFSAYYLNTGWMRFNLIEQAFTQRFIVIVCIFFLILLLAFVRLSNNFMKNTIKSRKSQFVLGVMLLLEIAIMGAHSEQFFPNFTFLAPPLSMFMAYYFINPKPRIFKEILFISLLFWIFYFQWKPIL